MNTGYVGAIIAFKKSLSRADYNGFAEISSVCLLAYGWKAALDRTLDHAKALGFHVVSISFNRVDYCIDFLTAPLDINLHDFITHLRVKKLCHYGISSVTDRAVNGTEHGYIRTVTQSNQVKSITLGKIPGRQIIVYDKRAEVIEKRKHNWFDAWGIDRADTTQNVYRVEVRAGKKHLLDKNIRTLKDFEDHIGLVLTDAVKVNRWVKIPNKDANVTRAPLHPIWEEVQSHMDDALAPYTAPLAPEVITVRMRQNKELEYKQQMIGNLGGYLACRGVRYGDMRKEMEMLISNVADSLSSDITQPIVKSYLRVKERWDITVQ